MEIRVFAENECHAAVGGDGSRQRRRRSTPRLAAGGDRHRDQGVAHRHDREAARHGGCRRDEGIAAGGAGGTESPFQFPGGGIDGEETTTIRRVPANDRGPGKHRARPVTKTRIDGEFLDRRGTQRGNGGRGLSERERAAQRQDGEGRGAAIRETETHSPHLLFESHAPWRQVHAVTIPQSRPAYPNTLTDPSYAAYSPRRTALHRSPNATGIELLPRVLIV